MEGANIWPFENHVLIMGVGTGSYVVLSQWPPQCFSLGDVHQQLWNTHPWAMATQMPFLWPTVPWSSSVLLPVAHSGLSNFCPVFSSITYGNISHSQFPLYHTKKFRWVMLWKWRHVDLNTHTLMATAFGIIRAPKSKATV